MSRRFVLRGLERSKEDLERWHASHWLGPGSFVSHWNDGKPTILPFRLFEAMVLGTCSTTWKDGTVSTVTWKETYHPRNASCMAVYASFEHRRDLAQRVVSWDRFQGELLPSRGGARAGYESMNPHRGDGNHPKDSDASMRSSMAWNLAFLGLWRKEKKAHEDRAKEKDSNARVAVALKVLKRTQRVVHIPVYLFDYNYGEKRVGAGGIVPETFQAMVNRLDGTVAAQRHVSPTKAGMLAGATMVSLTTLVDAWMGAPILSLEVGFWGSVAAAAGNTASKRIHVWRLQLEEHRRMLEEQEIFERAGQEFPGTSVSDEGEVLQMDWLEWERWAEQDKHHWDGERRRAWAEGLWKRQLTRRLERKRHAKMLEHEIKRESERLAREARHKSQRTQPFGWNWEQQGQRDSLGYYRLLGLEHGLATQEEVKKAYHVAAKKCHPDMFVTAHEKEGAALRFRRIQAAYTTLRDPRKRALYDAGRSLDTPP